MLFVAAFVILTASPADAVESGSLDVRWNGGSSDCVAHPQPPLQVHRYNAATIILRENPCSTFEAPFLYLLIGQSRALLIDTGDVGDARAMPLAKTVTGLLPAGLPLLVVHTHRHMDHRAGDGQFADLPRTQVVGYDIDSVKRFYHFTAWPNDVAQIDLGSRIVDVIPTPGHNETHVAFYDRNTALLFSGDFLMPGRLLIDDTAADIVSAHRVVAFLAHRPLAYVLGGHIEFDAKGNPLPWESTWHPNEHVLELKRAEVEALPAALEGFNGFYSRTGPFIMLNSMHILYAMAGAAAIVLAGLIWGAVRLFRRRRKAT